MIKNISVPYVPLLEGVTGKLFLTNNASSILAYETGGDPIPASVAIQSGVLGFGKSSESIYQGRLAVQFDAISGKHELVYNGTNWTSDAADFFNLAIELKDIAFYKSNQTDVYDYTFNAAPNDSWGGSRVRFQVAALAQPRIASITPASIVCDGTPQTITINLKRRLHSSQNPTVTLAAAPGSAPVTLSPPQAIRNTAGQIIGWSMVVTASPQPAASVSLVMTASESVTFLKDELIVTETVTYLDAEDIGGFGVSQYNGTAGFSVVASSLEAGQGSDPYYGKLKSVKYVPSQQGSPVYATRDAMFAGVLDTKIEVVNGTNSFGKVEIIAKPSGTNTRTVLGTCNKVLNGIVPNPSGSGDSVYKATHTLAFRTSAKPTGLAGADLSSHDSWDIGYTCYSASGEALATNWFGSYVNGNLSLNYPAYLMYVVMGAEVYKWRPVTGWEGITPTLKGEVTFYLSENWNAYKGMGGTVNAWDTLDYRLDAGSWVTTVDPTHPETRQNFSEDYGVKIATLNTASLANGNHTLEWRLDAAFMTQNGDTARSYVLPFSTNQGVTGGDPATFMINTTSPLSAPYIKGVDTLPVEWNIQLYPQNGIAGTVSYSLLGALSGMFATFTPPSGVFSSTNPQPLETVLRVEAPASPSGLYSLSVVAECAGVTRSLELSIAVRPPSTGCVPAGTPIETIYGSVPVESIRCGDIVVSYNDKTLEKGTAIVMGIPTYENRQLYEIVTSNGTLVCSHDHRLAVMSQLGPSYLPARGVAVGDVVYNFKEGSLLPSDVIAVIPLERHEKVYHLTLKSDHVFIAGGFAAHNMKDPGPDIPVDPNDPRDWQYQL